MQLKKLGVAPLFLARSTFLLFLAWASPALANQCYNQYDSCNRSPIAQSDPAECNRQYHACLADVERDAADAARRQQEQEFRSSRNGGHGGGYASAEPESSAPVRERTILNTQSRSFTDIPLSPSRSVKADDEETSRCPQSAYPYQGPNGVVCASTGAIAQANLAAVRGRMENEMMGFFTELSSSR